MLYVFVNHVINVLNGKEKNGKERGEKNGTETKRKGTVKKCTLFHDRYCNSYPSILGYLVYPTVNSG